ncbi:hypothetical protein LJC27_04765, partial [Christensenellaceae bacterium OttesenSCG-928-M15]|nr:hypothetical protein [Christensenellaceae bacterium OttesenSCG-928-M15]
YAKAKAELEAEGNGDLEPIFDMYIPGCRGYYFKGVAPGEAAISVFYRSTETGEVTGERAVYNVKVSEDLRVEILSSETFGGDGIEKYISVSLGAYPFDDVAWTYTADGEGIVEEVDQEEFAQWLQAQAALEAQDEEEMVIYDLHDEYALPGYRYYFFKGAAPGRTTLHFVYELEADHSSTGYEAFYDIIVFDDLSLQITDVNDISPEE